MELKQLEFFITCVECGSLGKSANKLYTSQPNVSKVIRSLENELGNKLFERNSKGLKVTPYGKSIYDYALNIIKNSNLIKNVEPVAKRNTFFISSYQSNLIAQILVNMLKQNPNINIRLHQGTVEEILSQVEQGISEIGVIYISQKHLTAFLNIISGKRMEFVQLDKLKACIYVGKENPLYNHSTINLEELKNLRYVRGLSDFFSIDDGLEKISLGLVNSDLLTPAVYTNSEHFTTNLLLHTDLVEIGISIDNPKKKQHEIKSLAIEGEDTNLCIGYVVQEGHSLSDHAVELINRISNILHP